MFLLFCQKCHRHVKHLSLTNFWLNQHLIWMEAHINSPPPPNFRTSQTAFHKPKKRSKELRGSVQGSKSTPGPSRKSKSYYSFTAYTITNYPGQEGYPYPGLSGYPHPRTGSLTALGLYQRTRKDKRPGKGPETREGTWDQRPGAHPLFTDRHL